MEQLSDLIQKAQQGDKEAFGALYKQYYRKIFRYCKINLYKDAIAEDVCQETFVRAWKALPKFTITQDGTFQAFLFRIARNLLIDLGRKKKEYSLKEYEHVETDEDFAADVDRQTTIEQVKVALAKLKDKDRQILILRYFEEMSHTEVAAIIGIKEGALRVRTIRLLQKLKELLKKT
jgi:RNA polymerase sigma-70 factor, ECF subfamily